MDKDYIELLEAILRNSSRLKRVAVILFKEGLDIQNREEKMAIVAYGQNFLFALIEEIGKFYLTKEQYPKRLEQINLSEIGFRNHDKKLSAVISSIRKRKAKNNELLDINIDQGIGMLRKFKDTTLHVDYRNGKIVLPQDSLTLTREIFNSFIDFVFNLEKMAKIDLEEFKKNPRGDKN